MPASSRPILKALFGAWFIFFLAGAAGPVQGQVIPQIQVEILTAFDLSKSPLELSAGDHLLFLDGKAVSFSGTILLNFKESIQVQAGGANLSGMGLEINPNQDTSLAKIKIEGKEKRDYPGSLRFEKVQGRWTAVNELPIEEYVAAVTDAENAARDKKFLELMSIVIRTHALAGGPHEQGRFCDRTCCMVYRGAPGKEATAAAQATKGQVLTYQGSLVPAYFHGCCVGETLPVEKGILHAKSHDALPGVRDVDEKGHPWCRHAPHYSWTRTISSQEFIHAVMEYMKSRGLGEPARPITVSRETEEEPFLVSGGEGEQSIPAGDFRMFLGRKLGWNLLLSDRFSIREEGGQYVITGHGFGHRVGLCQAGALARLRSGQSIREVLQAYFPGADIQTIGILKKKGPESVIPYGSDRSEGN